MTMERRHKAHGWTIEVERRLAAAGSSKRALARGLEIDYGTLFKWMRRALNSREQQRVEAALREIEGERHAAPVPTIPTTALSFEAQIAALRELRTRIDAAIAALEGITARRTG